MVHNGELLIEYEQNVLKQNKLLFIKDYQGNRLDDSIIYSKYDITKYLLSLQHIHRK